MVGDYDFVPLSSETFSNEILCPGIRHLMETTHADSVLCSGLGASQTMIQQSLLVVLSTIWLGDCTWPGGIIGVTHCSGGHLHISPFCRYSRMTSGGVEVVGIVGFTAGGRILEVQNGGLLWIVDTFPSVKTSWTGTGLTVVDENKVPCSAKPVFPCPAKAGEAYA